MLKRILYRLSVSFLVLLGVSVLIFSLARIIPGDPARLALGAQATEQAVNALREQMHLNAPLWQQYIYFLNGVRQGDLGISLYTDMPVVADIASYLPATLELVFVASICIIIIGIPLGVLSVRYQNSIIDYIVRLFSIASVAAPSFLWAVVFMLIFAYNLELFPISGRISEANEPATKDMSFILFTSLFTGQWQVFFDAISHIILPAFTLALSGMGQAIRLTIANMKLVMQQPYMETVRAYNIPKFKIFSQYAIRPALIPMLTILGLDIASMLGNAFLVEAIFAWPGIAKYGVSVVLHKDLNAIVGVVLVMSLFFLVINIIIDVLIGYINPKIRFGERQS